MRIINLNTIDLNGGVTQADLFDDNGKIKKELIDSASKFEPHKCSNADDTPKGVKWIKDGKEITGTLVASESTFSDIYYVPMERGGYAQYVTFRYGKEGSYTYKWECAGSGFDPTDIEERLDKLDSSVNTIIVELAGKTEEAPIDGSAYVRKDKEWVKIDDVIETDKHFKYDQVEASTCWDITHNLGKYPSVTTIANDELTGSKILIFGDIEYDESDPTNVLHIHFNSPVSGNAYIN